LFKLTQTSSSSSGKQLCRPEDSKPLQVCLSGNRLHSITQCEPQAGETACSLSGKQGSSLQLLTNHMTSSSVARRVDETADYLYMQRWTYCV
jgi:hypothetical protein